MPEYFFRGTYSVKRIVKQDVEQVNAHFQNKKRFPDHFRSVLTFAGVSHLTFNRSEFLAQVPQWLPVDPDVTVILSGIVEISLGLAFIFAGKYKKWVGITAAVFFVLIFPGNISQYVNKVNAFGLNTDKARLIRLFFQPVLILWALWSTNVLSRKNQQSYN